MLLNQLIKINEQGLVADAVSFGLMDDPDKNLRLCQGFVFNYDSDPKKLNSSTVGVLDALRRSFHSPSEPNIHLMVQDYGKGKSHFALAIANFFSKSYDSPEVQGVLQQVEYATSSSNSILESLRHYKQRGRHLVICLSGDKTIDLKKHFLQALRKALHSEGITDTIAQQICKRPLEYLRGLDTKQRETAEAFLERKDNPEGDLNSIEQLLEDDNYQVITRVKEICRELTGVTPDFDADVEVEAILTDLINGLCTGANPRFQGILILFDELYNYLQSWASDPVRAGSSTLQNITNIGENFKGRIALISFTQRRPQSVNPSKNIEDYNRLLSRIERLPSTYEPAASLELVLNSLLTQQDQTAAWQEFRSQWLDTLTAVNTNIYRRTANYYQNRKWSPQKFFSDITLGCFPLHPLTSYLLCNLDFTQGRTAIQFVQVDVKNFIIEQSVEKNGSLNFIYPVALVDAFADNFAKSDYSAYSAYKHAYDSIVASADPEELTILKALFLFYASASTNKLTKQDGEKHEEILALLTGMSEAKVKNILYKLCKVRQVIYHNLADKTYRFYSGGVSIQDLRKRIEEEVAHKSLSIECVQDYCQSKLKAYFGSDTVNPTQFIEENRLINTDWLFKCEVYTAAKFRRALNSSKEQPFASIGKDELGIVAYVIAETSEELAALRSEIEQLLTPSPSDATSIKRRMAVAIASVGAAEIARLLYMLENAKRKSIQDFGAALTQLQQEFEQQIDSKTRELFQSCIYHCHIPDKVPLSDRTNSSRVVSAILKDLYPFVPTVNKVDKMALKNSTGSEVVGYVSKQLLENGWCTTAFHKQSYETVVKQVFLQSWGLLKPDAQKYFVVVPSQRNIKAAWDKISEMLALNEKLEKVLAISKIWETLSSPPYGYNEYTFTMLLAGWLAYHRAEVYLKGGFGIPSKDSSQVPVKTEPIKAWAATNILNKPKDFIQKWVLSRTKPQLIRRKPSPCPEVPKSVDYEQAQQFIQQIKSFLASTPDSDKVNEISNICQWLTKGAEKIDELFEPIVRAENLLNSGKISNQADIASFLQLFPRLQQPLSAISEGYLTISPTQQQRQRIQVLQAVTERIGQVIEAESQRSRSLGTEAECGAYKTEIQRLIEQINQVADLPPRFIDTLQNALRAADIALAEIVEQKKVNDCLLQIQSQYKNLSDLATQHEYTRIQVEIEKLAEGVPATKETDIYKNTIQALEEKQEALIQQVATWESQLLPLISCEQAMQLSQSINRQIERFTDKDSKQRLNELLQNLENIILERDREEHLEGSERNLEVSSKDLHNRLHDIQTIEAIRQHSLAKANTIYLCEDAIRAIALLQENLNNPEQFATEVEKIIREFKDKIASYNTNLNSLCDRLSQIETYTQLESIRDEYAKLDLIFKDSAEYSTYKQLQAQIRLLAEDLEQIRQLETLTQQTNSIADCDRTLEAITNQQAHLQNPDRFKPKLLQLAEQLHQKKQAYIEQQKIAASSWLENLETQKTNLEQHTTPEQKLEAANQLLNQIEKQKNHHEEKLETNQKQTLEQIINHCIQIQNQDRESQILHLFQKLPPPQRQTLFQKLAKYISNKHTPH